MDTLTPLRSNMMVLGNLIIYLENMKTEKYPDGIIIASDLGNHWNCPVVSNCPEAIKLRKILTEAGLTLKDVIKDWEAARAKPPEPIMYKFPDVDAKMHLKVGNQKIEIDMKEELESQIKYAFTDRLERFKNAQREVERLGVDLYSTYLSNIYDIRRSKLLPQMMIPLEELLKYHCMIDQGGKDSYLFIFPFTYNPQWLFYGTKRYKLDPAHIEGLQRNVYAMFTITQERNIIDTKLITSNGEKFRHYHGDKYDCWGQLKLPKRWDYTLKSLSDLVYQMQAALATINRDSLMKSTPPGMIDILVLMDSAKLEGIEDVVNTEEVRIEAPQPEPVRHWGEGGDHA